MRMPALLMPGLGADDVIGRLVPALAGMGLVLLPWLMRRWLGGIGALVAGLLLAVSPTLGVASRTADGTMLALLAGGLLLVAWLRYHEEGDRRWLAAANWLRIASASSPPTRNQRSAVTA